MPRTTGTTGGAATTDAAAVKGVRGGARPPSRRGPLRPGDAGKMQDQVSVWRVKTGLDPEAN